ncbi:hypothetical protein RMATCC62417_10846 [Rhizopus microsporus]|nr:hypothetical protein RMATCC62417_10846 [Rhizopus microsporus]
MENNTSRTTICSSCIATLSADSRYRTYQTCRERVAASRRRRRTEQEEQEGNPVRPRGRPRVEPSQTIPAAYISQLSRLRPLDLEPQLQLLPDPPQYLKDLLERTDTQGHHFKDNLRQYNTAFAFTSLGCDIVSAEERNANNNRGGLSAFQIHDALCHRQGPLTPTEDSEPSYIQLYIFDPCYAAERRQVRNSNLDPEIIRELSVMLAQCNPFAHVYRHAHEILSNHESDSNNAQTETNTPYIVISPSMRMHLIKGGNRRTHNLPTMEEVTAVIPIAYSDKSFRSIVLTSRSSNRDDRLRQGRDFEQDFQLIDQTHAVYVCTNYVLIFHHGAYGYHSGLCFFFSLFTVTSSITVPGV